MADENVPDQLVGAVGSLRGGAAADRLCVACAEMLSIDAATVSLVFDNASTRTFGASSVAAQKYGEVEFTLGEGPCLDSVRDRCIVAATDLAAELRWSAYTPMMLGHAIHSVYAIPVIVGGQHLGALDAYRREPGPLTSGEVTALMMAAELATMPLLDLLGAVQDADADPNSDLWSELSTLTRTEVNQATGMLVAQLGVPPADALVRLRAYAYTTGASAIDIARDILDRRVRLDSDQ